MNETNRIEYKLEYNSDIDIEKEVIAFFKLQRRRLRLFWN